MFRFLRSLAYSIYFFISIIFFAVFILLCFPFNSRLAIAAVTVWCKSNLAALKISCGIDYEIRGKANFAKLQNSEEGYVLMCKHQSTLETIILFALLEDSMAIILKKELLALPFYGWGLAKLKPIAIDRKERESALEQVIEKGSAVLESGRHVLIFPEGTRTPYGAKTKVKRGGVCLAQAANVDMMPIALNTGKFWARNAFRKKPGKAIISFGEFISTADKTIEALQQEVAERIDQDIASFDRHE